MRGADHAELGTQFGWDETYEVEQSVDRLAGHGSLTTPGVTVRGFGRLDGDEGFAEVFFEEAFLADDAIPGGVVLGEVGRHADRGPGEVEAAGLA